MQETTAPRTRGWTLDRNVDRLRRQHGRLAPLLMKGDMALALEAFDLETERADH